MQMSLIYFFVRNIFSALCDKKYEEVMNAIDLSRKAGFMPFQTKEPAFFSDSIMHNKMWNKP